MARVGFGYDSHRLAAPRQGSAEAPAAEPADGDRPLVLGGVRIPHDRGLAGHSDADAVLHAVTDAILGALAAGDIGEHFPDTDPRWKNADSGAFVAEALRVAGERRLVVGNCDVTILAEAPRLGPHKERMRESIAGLLSVAADRVSVKAKTGEGMGFVGRGEGIAVMAVVLLEEREEKDA